MKIQRLVFFPMLVLLFACSPEANMEQETDGSLSEKRLSRQDTSGKELGLPAPANKMAFIATQEVSEVHNFSRQPDWNTESYNAQEENSFVNCALSPLSTFSADVDSASYANIRRFIRDGHLPPVGAVRIEEMVNYFDYHYPQPAGQPLGIYAEVGPSPFHADYRLARIGIQAKNMAIEELPPSNLVFLIDVSGSMYSANKLPLLQKSMKLLLEHLGKQDRVSIVTYAGRDAVALPPTSAAEKKKILAVIDSLQAGGSTDGASGIVTAYKLAQQVYMPKGNNRVILASDGDFNVGITSRGELHKLIEEKRKSGVYLTVLGFGSGNYHDDTMEILADKGNGNYAYIDSLLEAKKVLVREMGATLFTVARDVKIQVEFNPAQVGAYRLIGYENRRLANEDFLDDRKDAGEIGSGHTVTALYEIIPPGHADIPRAPDLKYQKTEPANGSRQTDELFTVSVRYKPGQDEQQSRQISLAVSDSTKTLAAMPDDFRFAAAVAGYGMLLRRSPHVGNFSWNVCLDLIRSSKGKDPNGYRAELLRLVEMTELLQ